jgi:uncharacterized membrane protein YfcA
MPSEVLPILAALFLVVGALYASVGHAGASGYLAVMALMGVDALVMRPTALSLNVLVAAIAFTQFARAGHFRWSLFWPLALASIPCAFLGGRVHVPADPLKLGIGIVLVCTAAWMAWIAWQRRTFAATTRPPSAAALLGVGAILGLIAGLTGTGGGIFLSPVMLLLGWADTKRTAATASLFVLVNSVAGLGGIFAAGWRPPHSLAWLAAAACIGGLFGATIGSRRATPRALNLALAAVLLIAGAKLIAW